MKRLRAITGAVAAAGALAGAGAAQAAIINWTITGGALLWDVAGGVAGTFSGSFSYDTTAGTFTAWNIQTQSDQLILGGEPQGTPFGTNYASSIAGHAAVNDGPGPHFSTPPVDLPAIQADANLWFSNVDPSAAGSVALLTGSETVFVHTTSVPFAFTRQITGGRAVGVLAGPAHAVPEPATWALMILGFGAAGAWLRRAGAGRPA